MSVLPYQPAPYPDEILGSWLSRLKFHNGDGAWSTLLRSVGRIGDFSPSQFHIFDAISTSEALINSLGYTIVDAYMELTMLPYWLAFDGLEITRDLHEPFSMDDLRIARKRGSVTRLSRLMHGGNQIKYTQHPKLCPECLENDLREYGEPFLHRVHQLPDVSVCIYHRCRLIDHCQECGAIIAPIHLDALPFARLTCTCGNLLSARKKDSYRVSKMEIALAKIGNDALAVFDRQWNYRHVRQFLRQQLGRESWHKAVSRAFSSNLQVSRRLSARWAQIAAPHCAAILAAMKIDFIDAMLQFKAIARSAIQQKEKPDPLELTRLESLTVESARKEMQQIASIHPDTKLSAICPEHYWYLKLYDDKWLRGNFPGKRLGRIPTIKEDREAILKRMERCAPNSRMLPNWVFDCSFGIRARLRDEKWMRYQHKKLIERYNEIKRNKRVSIRNRQIDIVSRVIEQIVGRKDRPLRISAPELAKITGITPIQIRTLLAEHPSLAKEIDAANKDKLRRLFMWAIRELEDRKEPYFKSDILLHASRRSDAETRSVLNALLATMPADSVTHLTN